MLPCDSSPVIYSITPIGNEGKFDFGSHWSSEGAFELTFTLQGLPSGTALTATSNGILKGTPGASDLKGCPHTFACRITVIAKV
jgi:hypothetical protein